MWYLINSPEIVSLVKDICEAEIYWPKSRSLKAIKPLSNDKNKSLASMWKNPSRMTVTKNNKESSPYPYFFNLDHNFGRTCQWTMFVPANEFLYIKYVI